MTSCSESYRNARKCSMGLTGASLHDRGGETEVPPPLDAVCQTPAL
jgi:hypothetical protein